MIGPRAELRLPAGLAIATTTGSAWEFPLVGKYKFGKTGLAHPYVEAGVSWDKLSGLTQTVTSTVASLTGSTSSPKELNKDVTRGFVMGVGVDVKLLVIHITQEIRYTRCGAEHFIDVNGLKTTAFLVSQPGGSPRPWLDRVGRAGISSTSRLDLKR